jgi:multiple sugar transport system substrate-binding protein
MDENVLFDKQQDGPSAADLNAATNSVTPDQTQPPPDPQSGMPGADAQQPVDPSQPQPIAPTADQTLVDQSGLTQPADQVPPVEGAPTDQPPSDIPPQTPPPASGGIAGLLSSGGFKKLIIGIVAVLLITFIVILLLPKGQSTKEVKLVWWGLWEDARVVQPVISDFERENPNIKVEYIKQSPLQYRERLLTRIKNGTGPDIFTYHNTWYPMYSDVLLALSNDVITQSEFDKGFYPVMQKDLIHNGGIYGIPMGADTLSMFVNTKMFEDAGVAPPTNWDDFVKAAKKLTVKETNGNIKTAGAALGTYNNINHAPDIMSVLFIQQGVDLNKFPDASQTDNEKEALNFYLSFAQGDDKVWDNTLDSSLLAFSKGNLAIYFGYSWDIFAIQKLNKDLEFQTYAIPSLYGKNTTVASYWVNGVSAQSNNRPEAYTFMHYLAQKSTAERLYKEESKVRPFGAPYARTDLASTLKSNKLVYPFVSQLPDASSSFFASDTHDGEGGLNFMANQYLQNAINGVIIDNTSMDSVIEILTKGIAQVFEKYGIQ